MKETMMEKMINDTFIELVKENNLKEYKHYQSGKIFGYLMAYWDCDRITQEEFNFLDNARRALMSI